MTPTQVESSCEKTTELLHGSNIVAAAGTGGTTELVAKWRFRKHAHMQCKKTQVMR